MQKIILFDIDHTIFDTILYRERLFENLAKILEHDAEELYKIAQGAYAKIRKAKPYLTPDIFLEDILAHTKKFEKQNDVQSVFWNKQLYESCIYPDVAKAFSYISKANIPIGIFSTGDTAHQKIKIESLKEYL